MKQGIAHDRDPPPPYEERKTTPSQFQVPRKPVSGQASSNDITPDLGKKDRIRAPNTYTVSREQLGESFLTDPSECSKVSSKSRLSSSSPANNTSAEISRDFSSTLSATGFFDQQDSCSRPPGNIDTVSVNETSQTKRSTSGGWKKAAVSHAQTALEEAKHFLGGLIVHPSVSNKHYTVLRHSHGIVFYQGSNTFLTISIFSDEPLPRDRTIWMQCKGWSGKTGMKAKSLLGLNSSWVNVTPNLAIQSDQVNASDERAWQRDIKRFQKKILGTTLDRHVLRETAIIRVPTQAADGYYQLVICHGDQKRKTLCNSPVFRVISASSDPSTLRGASLSTLPVELGLWVGGVYTRTTAQNFISPIASRIKSVYQPLLPSATTQTALQGAYSISGIEDRVNTGIDNVNSHYDQIENMALSFLGPTEIDVDHGPTAPYPVDFQAKADLNVTMSSFDANSLPQKINLKDVPDRMSPRLDGFYFAWCKLIHESLGGAGKTQAENNGDVGLSWAQCIIFASRPVSEERVSNVRSRKAPRFVASIKFLEDLDIPPCARMQIRIMGFIRPFQAGDVLGSVSNREVAEEQNILQEACDIELTRNTLDQPSWQPNCTNPGRSISMGSCESERQVGILDKAKDGYASVRLKSQTIIGQIPFHRVGVRTSMDELKDKTLHVSGYYIAR